MSDTENLKQQRDEAIEVAVEESPPPSFVVVDDCIPHKSSQLTFHPILMPHHPILFCPDLIFTTKQIS